jgi:hypothetical protein
VKARSKTESRWRRTLWSEHRLTVEDFARLANEQKCRCAVCGDKLDFDRFTHVDHDHLTGRVRGLLCHCCNVLLGMADESREILQSAILYLTFHRSPV